MSQQAEIDAAEFERRIRDESGTVVLDVRSRDEFDDWQVDAPEARVINIPEQEVDPSNGAFKEIGESETINIVCAAGNASSRVAEKLIATGLDAVNVKGGMIAWSRLLIGEEIEVGRPFTVIQFRREARGCLSYMVECGGEALVIDPSPDSLPYSDEATRRGWKIVAIFDTHVHADHVSGAEALSAATGARVLMPKPALERGLDRPEVELVGDGDTIEVGGEAIEVVALPGHTTEMTGLAVPGGLICGDSLFADSIARPDLQHADLKAARAAANDLYLTLTSKILSRGDRTRILPGHYPGGRLDGPVAPTLSEVKESVEELALGAEPFADRLVADLPDKPANFDTIIGVNLGTERIPEADLGRLETGGNSCAAR
ncbi:MAG: MBL fold metallo-hydrolase [bacterium]